MTMFGSGATSGFSHGPVNGIGYSDAEVKQYDIDRLGKGVAELTERTAHIAGNLRCIADRLYGSQPSAPTPDNATKPYGVLADFAERLTRLKMMVDELEQQSARLGNL